ncbi:hypothetical protein M011DRAFT_213916 [Sporormia fimetaria CBS 119925]|uniref:Uncharacterized protein n=1 Tax=Sporormia fimetaria CBS 119925 TaxID=1340428 RepID=A0A6A6V0R0_9PLEO|nr:hypothetical protein M011DRAFT_213916 [Sporormia fimetaria CBS 119925]
MPVGPGRRRQPAPSARPRGALRAPSATTRPAPAGGQPLDGSSHMTTPARVRRRRTHTCRPKLSFAAVLRAAARGRRWGRGRGRVGSRAGSWPRSSTEQRHPAERALRTRSRSRRLGRVLEDFASEQVCLL